MSGVLVTGGAGFIGSHLVDRLIAEGREVTVLDDMSTGSERNLAQHKGNERLRLVRGSVLDVSLVDQLVGANPLVLHLAAAVGVRTTLVGAAIIGAAVTLGAYFLPGMTDIERRSSSGRDVQLLPPAEPSATTLR